MPKTAAFTTDPNELYNGEREVSTYIRDFPKDHIARYEFVNAFLESNSRVLDIGCGVGYGSNMLAKTAKHVTNIELRPHVVEFARQHWSGENQTYICGDALSQTTYPSTKFDIVTAFEIIEHLPDDRPLLPLVRDHLSPTGIFFASVPNLNIISPDDNPWHFRHYTPDQFRRYLHTCFKHVCLFGVRQDRVVPGEDSHTLVAVAYQQWYRKFRIAFVSQEYPAPTNLHLSVPPSGGIGTYTKLVAEELTSLGHEVSIVSRSCGQSFVYQENGVHIHRLADRPLSNRHILSRWNRVAALTARARAVKSFFSNNDDFDIVETAELRAETILLWIRRQRNARRSARIVRLHTPTYVMREESGTTARSWDQFLAEWIEKISAHLADVVTSPSANLLARCRHDWRLPEGAVIPNPVETHSQPLIPLASSNLSFGYFPGRFDDFKGFPVLAEALMSIAAVKNGRLGFQITLVGSDYISQSSAELLADLMALPAYTEKELSILPRQPKEAVEDLIEQIDCIVISSKYENSPYVMLEAMARGKLVIAPQVGGVPETIQDGHNGFLYDEPTSFGLAACINRVAHCTVDYLNLVRSNSLNTAAKRNSLKEICQLLEVYYTFVANRPMDNLTRPVGWWLPTRGPLLPKRLHSFRSRLKSKQQET